jgi:hypothetical protein
VRQWFNPTIAHQHYCTSEHVFGWAARDCKTISRQRCTLIGVRSTECAELVAVEVCRQCQASGRRDITATMIERVLHQLQAHRPDCRCGLCEAAAKESADQVYRVVSSWQRSTSRRRVARMTR